MTRPTAGWNAEQLIIAFLVTCPAIVTLRLLMSWRL